MRIVVATVDPMSKTNSDPRTMDRADLEMAIVENDIMPTATEADCALFSVLNDEALRAIVIAWIEAGDECAAC